MPARAHRLLIPLAALLAILPILLAGPSCGHDFDFHLLSWLEASTQFAHLHYPHWAYTPAFNAGEPRFLFYPPISWSLGAILGLILPWNLVPATFTFIALTLSGFTMHRLAASHASANAATLAAILYLANPYMLFTAYERTAYGELLAAAWLPLLFLAAFAPRIRIVPLAIPIALLWLTNAPAAVMACYALAFLTLLRLVLPENHRHSGQSPESQYLPSSSSPKPLRAPFIAPLSHAMSGKTSEHRSTRLHLALSTIAATALGLTLSAFYLLPAAYERPSIQSDMAVVTGMRIADNTLFHHMSPPTDDTLAHDVVLHTASLIALTLLAAILVAFFTLLRRHKVSPTHYSLPTTHWRSLPFLTLLIAFLLTRPSLPIWAHTPELRFLQFPWRLTALLATIFALLAALAFDRLKLTARTTGVLAITLLAVLIPPAWHLFDQLCDLDDTVPSRVALYHSNLGTDPTDEYTPTTADNDSLKHSDPPYWLAPIRGNDPINTPAPTDSQPGPAPTHLTLTLNTPEFLILNLRQFPDWRITLNGSPITPNKETRDDGLITLPLPAGPDIIDIAYHRPPDQTAGLALTALAILLTLALQTKTRRSF
jgi:hypothetical protein